MNCSNSFMIIEYAETCKETQVLYTFRGFYVANQYQKCTEKFKIITIIYIYIYIYINKKLIANH